MPELMIYHINRLGYAITDDGSTTTTQRFDHPRKIAPVDKLARSKVQQATWFTIMTHNRIPYDISTYITTNDTNVHV